MKWIDSFIDRLIALICALVFVQAPAFFQQYLNRMGGGLEELQRLVSKIHTIAQTGGTEIPSYIAKISKSSDVDLAKHGELLSGIITRTAKLSESYQALEGASAWTKPFVFAKNFDPEIASSTLSHFQPGLPLTPEALIYAVIGLILGGGVYHLLKKLGSLLLLPFTKSTHG